MSPGVTTTYTLNCFEFNSVVSSSATVTVTAPMCTPDDGSACAANKCTNDSSCIGRNADCSTYPVWGTKTTGICAAPADLTAGQLSPTTATAGTAQTFTLPVTNTGGTSAAPFTSLLQKATQSNGSDAVDIKTASTGSLTFEHVRNFLIAIAHAAAGGPIGPGAPGSATFTYTFPLADGGKTLYLRGCADKSSAGDANGTVPESREDNNCGSPWTGITVNPAPVPAVSCNVSKTNPLVNETVTYTATPTNGASGPYAWTASDGGSFGSAATANRSFAAPGTYAMQVNATGAGSPGFCPNITVTGSGTGSGGSCQNTVPVSVTATPSRIQSGVATDVTFNIPNTFDVPGNCTLSGPGIAPHTFTQAPPASCTVPAGGFTASGLNITAQSTYTLTCGAQKATVIVNIVPKFQEF